MVVAILNHYGFETGDSLELAAAISAGCSIQGTTKRTGDYALRINASAQAARAQLSTITAASGLIASGGWGTDSYFIGYFMVAALPSAKACIFHVGGTTSGATTIEIQIDNSGNVTLFDRTNNSASAGTVTADGAWHQIKVRVQHNAQCDLSVDGGSVQSLTGLNQSMAGAYLGSRVDSVTYDIYFDDWVASTGGYGASSPAILRMDVDGDGADTAWGGSSADVDEVPNDGATTKITSSTNGQQESVTLESAASAGISGTIIAAKAVAAYLPQGSNPSVFLAMQEGGTTTETGSEANGFSGTIFVGMLKETNPRTSAAWTTSDLDGLALRIRRGRTGGADAISAFYTTVLFEGITVTPISLAGNQPAAAGAFSLIKYLIALAGAQPSGTGAVIALSFAAVAGNQPNATGALALIKYLIALAGDQPAGSGFVTADTAQLVTVEGNQPSASGALSAILLELVSLAGNQPPASGSIAAIEYFVGLAGSQPAPSGALTALTYQLLQGNQPTATGALSLLYKIALSGNQPAASGALALIKYLVALAGNQPAASGALLLEYFISLTGNQPAASGALLEKYLISLGGDQPGDSGQVVAKYFVALFGDQPAATGGILHEFLRFVFGLTRWAPVSDGNQTRWQPIAPGSARWDPITDNSLTRYAPTVDGEARHDPVTEGGAEHAPTTFGEARDHG